MSSEGGEDLSKSGRAAASLIAKGAAVFAAGWMAHTIIAPAQAADRADRIERIERTTDRLDKSLQRLDKNLARVLDKLGIEERP